MTIETLFEKVRSNLQSATYCPKKLAFLHAGVTAGVTLLFSIITHLLTGTMDTAVGLSGLDTRTTLSFIRTLLLFACTVALPFWDLGYTRAAVRYAKGETPTPWDLLTGFRRIFPALRTMLLRAVAVGILLFLSLQAATMLFMLSPFRFSLTEKAEALMAAETQLTPELFQQILPYFVPVYLLWLVVALVLFVPLFYKYRLADFALMDTAAGAFDAFKISARQTNKRRLQLFKLDLHFWWYYVLGLLTVVISYLDVLLPSVGIALNEEIFYWLFFILGQLATLTLHTFCTPKVQTAYALFAQGAFQDRNSVVL